jgi:hypothetical protein
VSGSHAFGNSSMSRSIIPVSFRSKGRRYAKSQQSRRAAPKEQPQGPRPGSASRSPRPSTFSSANPAALAPAHSARDPAISRRWGRSRFLDPASTVQRVQDSDSGVSTNEINHLEDPSAADLPKFWRWEDHGKIGEEQSQRLCWPPIGCVQSLSLFRSRGPMVE